VNVTADDWLIVGGELLFSIPLYIKIQTRGQALQATDFSGLYPLGRRVYAPGNLLNSCFPDFLIFTLLLPVNAV